MSLHTESEIMQFSFSFCFCIRHPFLLKCLDLIQKILWWTKVSEAVCKRDWQNVRSYLVFNMQKCLDSVCNDFYILGWL